MWIPVLVLLLAVISSPYQQAAAQERQSAIRSFAVNVPRQTVSTFLSQLEGFATRNGFRFAKAVVHPDGAHYSVDLQRKDVGIAAVNSFDIERFHVFLYANEPLPDIQARAQALIDALRTEFNGASGTTFLSREVPEQYVKTLGLQGLDGQEGLGKMKDLGFECDVKSEIPSGLKSQGRKDQYGKRGCTCCPSSYRLYKT